jgi:hypothetical protein
MATRADCAPVPQQLLGRVIVVAGTDPTLPGVVGVLVAEGAAVGYVGPAARSIEDATAFAADPADPQVWSRVAPHVEQRLGPIDGVVVDAATSDVVTPVFAGDLARRGHGAVVVVDGDWSAADVVSALLRTP